MSDIVVASSLPLQRSFFQLFLRLRRFQQIFPFYKKNLRLDHSDPKCTLDFRRSLESALRSSPRENGLSLPEHRQVIEATPNVSLDLQCNYTQPRKIISDIPSKFQCCLTQ